MSDIIHLLPDSVANQIAAGEVIQRPASVVKELIENAIDAEATEIQIFIKDAGRILIQVVDNGKGMSETDARLSFERHATSKISSANDLYTLRTMGFRGEALASIAAVAQVELRTRRVDDEIGTMIIISASKVERQEYISCPPGSNFMIKNIFFNLPARRKFLKSNQVEFGFILSEFERTALINTDIAFRLVHNDVEICNLPKSNFRQRIVDLFGKNINQYLLPVNVQTSIVSITGYIGHPEAVRKRNPWQYFFVNGRYMRHPYFYKAVISNYEQLLPIGGMPHYFLHLQVDPATIDVNIHPTKTEIKFENEQPIWQILSAAVKEALGKSNVAPTIDFDTENAPEIPVLHDGQQVHSPKVTFSPDYNPFKKDTPKWRSNDVSRRINYDWTQLYKNFQTNRDLPVNGEEANDLIKIPSKINQPTIEGGFPSMESTTAIPLSIPLQENSGQIDMGIEHL
ncbi:MAG: DNA mismatch repair endonuclease MutL, partial [Porphyromonadaceae bacterium]|nr:DNA mismatch repair endonuclease MutL [Porphyromonadaceae bacterium]